MIQADSKDSDSLKQCVQAATLISPKDFLSGFLLSGPPCINILQHTTAVQLLPVEQGFPGREVWLDWELTHIRQWCMMPGLKLRMVLERHKVQSQKTKSKPVHRACGKGQEWKTGVLSPLRSDTCQECWIEKGQKLSRGRNPKMDGAACIGPRVGGAASIHFLFIFN